MNLGLYGIGVIRKPSIDLEFEHKLKNCSGLSDIRKLVHESPEKNLKLLDESCKPCTQLIKDQFSRLQLKGVPFRVPEEASDRDIDELFKSLNLDKSKTPYNCVDDLRKRPKLTQYLAHCCRQRTYFFSVKKCGSQNCEICLPPRSIAQDFERLGHLPDPTPSSDDLHYKPFQEVFKTETDESATSPLKTLKDRGHKISSTLLHNSLQPTQCQQLNVLNVQNLAWYMQLGR